MWHDLDVVVNHAHCHWWRGGWGWKHGIRITLLGCVRCAFLSAIFHQCLLQFLKHFLRTVRNFANDEEFFKKNMESIEFSDQSSNSSSGSFLCWQSHDIFGLILQQALHIYGQMAEQFSASVGGLRSWVWLTIVIFVFCQYFLLCGPTDVHV